MALRDEDIYQLLVKLDEKQDKQSEKLTKLEVGQAKADATFEQHMKQDEQMRQELVANTLELKNYNNELRVHIAGVNELKEISAKQDKRIEALEAPRKAIGVVKHWMHDTAKIITAGAVITGFVHWLTKHL